MQESNGRDAAQHVLPYSERLRTLEELAHNEIEGKDTPSFLSICRLFGLADGAAANPDTSQLLALFISVKGLCKEYGIEVGQDFAKLKRREEEAREAELLEEDIDRLEIKLSKFRDVAVQEEQRQLEINRLNQIKEDLQAQHAEAERQEEVGKIHEEILALDRFLRCGGPRAHGKLDGQEHGVHCSRSEGKFHLLFPPFLKLSCAAVDYLYSTISVGRGAGASCTEAAAKSSLVANYIDYLFCINAVRRRKEGAGDACEKLDCHIYETLLVQRRIVVDDLCKTVDASRVEVLKRVFLLAAKRLVDFDREKDAVCISGSIPPNERASSCN